MAENNTLLVPVKTGFKSDEGYHRRNYRSIEDYLASPHISTAQIIELSADKITSGTVSSTLLVTGLIQAPAATGYRVEIGNATYPLRYWNGSTSKLSVDTSGNVVVSGDITATSGSITGTLTVSGTLDVSGLIRSPSTGYRIEIGNATYPLRYWNGTTTLLSVDTSGNITLVGTINDSSGNPIIRSNGYSRVKISNSADTVAHDTEETIVFDTEDADTDSYWSAGTPTYIAIPYTGQYLVLATLSWVTNNSGRRYMYVQSDDNSSFTTPSNIGYGSAAPIANDRTTTHVADVVDLTAGDYVRVRGYQNSGADLNTSARLAVVFMGPT